MIAANSSHTLRSLLRDTALQAALLSQQAEVPSLHTWRARCAGLVEQLRNAMQDADYDQAMIIEASYAQCALLDEAALRHLPDVQRREWQRQTLEMHYFNSNKAADAVYLRIEQLLRQPSPTAERIALYDMLLGLGFGGRHAAEDDPERQRIIAAFRSHAGAVAEAATATTAAPAASIKPKLQQRRHLPPGGGALLGWTTLGFFLALALWFGLERQLGQSAYHLFQLQTEVSAMSEEN